MSITSWIYHASLAGRANNKNNSLYFCADCVSSNHSSSELQ